MRQDGRQWGPCLDELYDIVKRLIRASHQQVVGPRSDVRRDDLGSGDVRLDANSLLTTLRLAFRPGWISGSFSNTSKPARSTAVRRGERGGSERVQLALAAFQRVYQILLVDDGSASCSQRGGRGRAGETGGAKGVQEYMLEQKWLKETAEGAERRRTHTYSQSPPRPSSAQWRPCQSYAASRRSTAS